MFFALNPDLSLIGHLANWAWTPPTQANNCPAATIDKQIVDYNRGLEDRDSFRTMSKMNSLQQEMNVCVISPFMSQASQQPHGESAVSNTVKTSEVCSP